MQTFLLRKLPPPALRYPSIPVILNVFRENKSVMLAADDRNAAGE